MTKGIGQVHCRGTRKRMNVIAMGQTAKGQRYIKKVLPLKAKKPSDPAFKQELAAAINELLG